MLYNINNFLLSEILLGTLSLTQLSIDTIHSIPARFPEVVSLEKSTLVSLYCVNEHSFSSDCLILIPIWIQATRRSWL